MSFIVGTVKPLPGVNGVILVAFAGITSADITTPMDMADYDSAVVHVYGTPGAGFAASLDGSNEIADSPTTFALVQTITALGITRVTGPLPRWLRLAITTGDGSTNVTAAIKLLRRAWK